MMHPHHARRAGSTSQKALFLRSTLSTVSPYAEKEAGMLSTSKKRTRSGFFKHIVNVRPRSYFDSLSEEAIKNIIRHVSGRPRRYDWMSFMRARDVLTLFRCESPLSTVSKRLIWQLDMRKFSEECQEHDTPWLGHNEESLLSSILEEGAESFKEIHVDNFIPFGFRDTYCPGFPKLETLKIRDKGVALLHCKGLLQRSNLRNLRLQCGEVFQCDLGLISLHCKALRCLWLMFGNVGVDLSQLFKSVGRNLEELCLSTSIGPLPLSSASTSFPVDWISPSLPMIGTYCRKLQKIRIEMCREELSTAFVKLCRGYGSQLKSLELFGCSISSTTLCQVAQACSQVSISGLDSLGDVFPEELIAMGPWVPRISISEHGLCNDNQLSLVNQRCINATQIVLSLSIENRDTLRILLSIPKLRLQEIRVRWHGPHQYNSELFDALSNCENLRIITYTGGMPSGDSLRKFVHSNKQLEEVVIDRYGAGGPCRCCGDPEIQSFYDWVPAVMEFSKLLRLRTLSLSCEGNLQRNVSTFNLVFYDACSVFRFWRYTSVSICGRDYFV